MTAKKLHALAFASTAVALIAGPAEAARTPTTQGIVSTPSGAVTDVRKGRLLITVLHDASGQLDGTRFYAGRVVFRQGKS